MTAVSWNLDFARTGACIGCPQPMFVVVSTE
jgi:hypothetical protein